jgi:hypothetical protein
MGFIPFSGLVVLARDVGYSAPRLRKSLTANEIIGLKRLHSVLSLPYNAGTVSETSNGTLKNLSLSAQGEIMQAFTAKAGAETSLVYQARKVPNLGKPSSLLT